MARHGEIYTALDENGNRINIHDVPSLKIRRQKKLRYSCELCGTELIAKTGDIVIHHFAHKHAADCDSWGQPMSEWHRRWQEKFPKEYQENVLCENGEKHRSDIFLPKEDEFLIDRIIEFQHSPISMNEMQKRNVFYTANNRELFWVFDFRDKKDKITIVRQNVDEHSYEHLPLKAVTSSTGYSLRFERQLPVWTRVFTRHEFIRANNSRIHILLQLSGDSGTGWLFDVSRFGYDSVLGSFIPASSWLRMINEKDSMNCSVRFDLSVLDKEDEFVFGNLGNPISFPEYNSRTTYWTEYGCKLDTTGSMFFTASQRSFKLERKQENRKPAKTYPKKHRIVEKSYRKYAPYYDMSLFVEEDKCDAKHSDNSDAGESVSGVFDYSSICTFSELIEAIRGCKLYVPIPSLDDDTFHLSDEDSSKDVFLEHGYIICRTHEISGASTYAVKCELMLGNGNTETIILGIITGDDEETRKLVSLHCSHPDLSIFCVNLKNCGIKMKNRSDMMALIDFILGRDKRSQPCDYGAARQWLYAASTSQSLFK